MLESLQKVGSDCELLRGRLQANRRNERAFFVTKEKQGNIAKVFLPKKNGAKRTLLRRGASDRI